MGDIVFASYSALIPELYLAVASLILLLFCLYRNPRANGSILFLALLVVAITGCLIYHGSAAPRMVMNGMFISDGFSVFVKYLLLASLALTLLLSSDWLCEDGGRPFEFIILLLLSTVGMMVLVSAADLLTVYLGLEMSSLALYVLAAFDRDNAKSSEAGLKYFMLGALASGMLLFGISLVYGFAGSTGFTALTQLFSETHEVSRGVTVGLVLVMIGFCFKVSAAPFHMWTPDVYEGAPTPVTAFFATATKLSAFALLARLLMQPFGALWMQWQQIIIFVSIASMVVGALAAIMQSNIKRLLAYSSIGHAGFVLMALAAANMAGVQALLIYLAVYVFMSAGAFGCVLMMRRKGHYIEDIRDLAGLSRTRPGMALLLATFMFSMAGIPPLAGFFGKFYAIWAAVGTNLTWLAVIGVITSVISGFYYIKVVKLMYFDEPAEPFDKHTSGAFKLGLGLCALGTLLFFLIPTPLIMFAKAAAEALVH